MCRAEKSFAQWVSTFQFSVAPTEILLAQQARALTTNKTTEANFTCASDHQTSIFTCPRARFTCPRLSDLGFSCHAVPQLSTTVCLLKYASDVDVDTVYNTPRQRLPVLLELLHFFPPLTYTAQSWEVSVNERKRCSRFLQYNDKQCWFSRSKCGTRCVTK